MYISFSTIITINVSLMFFLLLLLPLLNSRYCLKHLSSGCLVAFFIIIMIRALFPTEFSFAKTIRSTHVMVYIRNILHYKLYPAGYETTLLQLLFIIWITGAIFLLARKLYHYIRLVHLIEKMPDAKNEMLLNTWEHVKAKHPSIQNIRLVEINQNVSPFIIGLKKPIIVMPVYSFSQTEYEFILEHEIQHAIRHDSVLKLLADILCTVYWWNPLFYMLKKKTFDYIEIGNDKRLIAFMSDAQKNAYMECLVHTAQKINGRQFGFVLSFNKSDYRTLKKRLELIGNYSGPAKRWVNLPVFLILLLLLCLSTSFTLEPYDLSDGYIRLDQDNSYIIQRDGIYEIYYNGIFIEETDSLEYYNEQIPVYEADTISE